MLQPLLRGDYSTCPAARFHEGMTVTEEFCQSLSDLLKRNFEILILVVAALVLYLLFMSRSFDEVDAFNFALALTRYDVLVHQPHPPGYPIFVFIASIPYWITRDPLFSLTLVSCVSGAFTLVPTYAIAKRLFNREVAFFAAMALMVAPGFWLVSEQAVSDMLFTLFLTIAISQLLIGGESKLYLYSSWAMLGMALGVRILNFVFFIPFLYETIRVTKRVRDVLACVLICLGVLCLAMLPAVFLTGYSQYLNAVLDQLSRHLRDDVNPFGLSALGRLVFLFLTLMSGLGATLPFQLLRPDLYVSDSIFAGLNVILILFMFGAGVVLLRRVKRISKAFFLILWVFPYFGYVYLLGAPGYSRYLLPVLPPILIVLVGCALSAGRFFCSFMGRGKEAATHLKVAARYAMVILFVASMFTYSLPLATALHTELAPNVQLVLFVRSHYDPSTTTIIVFHEQRAFQVFGSDFRQVHCCDQIQKARAVMESRLRLSDMVLITDTALVAFRRQGITPTVVQIAVFSRSPLVKFEDNTVVLYRVVTVG